jgi:CHAT domain-containing protein
LIGRSLLRYATGDFAGAVELLSRGAGVRGQTLSLVLTAGSEDAKRQYLRAIADETDIAVSLHLGAVPASIPAATVALNNVLDRKGRSIDAMADHMATLRRRLNDADRELLNQLSQTQSRLAAMVLRGVSNEEQKKSVAALRGDIQRLEETISARSAEFRVSSQNATLTDVQRALPVDAALIEFVSYRPFFVRNKRDEAFGPPRYAAYVVTRDRIATAVDIGDAAQIDRDVQKLRVALSTPGSGTGRDEARVLYKQIVQPIEASIRDVAHVMVSPDGALNLVPFAALVSGNDKYMVEAHTISYVTSGRDLTRVRTGQPGTSRAAMPPVVLANPLFEGIRSETPVVPVKETPTATTRAVDARVLESALRFDSLPGTADEASELAKILPDARVYTGATATEALLKGLNAPSILHIATHGFFLRPEAASAEATSSNRGLAVAGSQSGAAPGDREDALLLSGLALAGANQRWSGAGEDGILTALEAAGLDLWGTRMVVLSACETGIGDARNGEGVYGLRRALVLAGSESQVMSLWQVSDTATRDLMISFYLRLRAGEGRAAALRQVQLAMLKSGRNRDHPFYWSSFILSGDWRQAF